MAIVRWQPARELDSVQHEVNRLLGSFFATPTAPGRSVAARRWVPATDLVQREDSYVLHTDLPGVDESDVKVEVEDSTLRISGERKAEKRDGEARVERAFGSFSRSLRLPEGVDADAIEARFDKGVLEVTIPKPERKRPHRVAISVGGEQPAAAIEGSDGEK